LSILWRTEFTFQVAIRIPLTPQAVQAALRPVSDIRRGLPVENRPATVGNLVETIHRRV
jgi:hypothetical protein